MCDKCGDVAPATKPSYHDKIQSVAREIETARGQAYDKSKKETIRWTEDQLQYIYAIVYKSLRVKNQTRSKVKALDDILDIYNYAALLYDNLVSEQ